MTEILHNIEVLETKIAAYDEINQYLSQAVPGLVLSLPPGSPSDLVDMIGEIQLEAPDVIEQISGLKIQAQDLIKMFQDLLPSLIEEDKAFHQKEVAQGR
ncbi:MAG: hypothetical protein FWF45_02085 [Coriobacteriia bacterium]|nr:hypothetical protein [Coriobacteriia bacterium]